MNLRPATPADRAALYDICLKTGDSGEDATPLYRDPLLLGHVYAGPYLAHSPEFCFVLEDEQGVCGYVLGTLDSWAFEAKLEREWWPELRRRYPLPTTPPETWTPDERLIRLLHERGRYGVSGSGGLLAGFRAEYPSHLHIDLLPRAQGRGGGKKLMHTLFDALRAAGSPGIHLGVGGRNGRAQAFYRHLGARELRVWDGGSLELGWHWVGKP